MRPSPSLSWPLLALVAACGGAPTPVGPATEPVELRWLDAPAPPERSVAAIALPEDPDGAPGWTFDATRVRRRGGGEPSLVVAGLDDVRALFAAGVELADCNLLRLDVRSVTPTALRVGVGHLDPTGQPRMRWSQDVVHAGRDARTRAEFWIEPQPGDTHLVLHGHGRKNIELDLYSLELVHAAHERRVAGVDEPPRWAELATEARPAHAVAPGRDVGCALAPTRGGRLAFGWATPRPMSGALRITLRWGDERTTLEVPLEDPGGTAGAWRDAALDLPDSGPAPVEVRFTVDGADSLLLSGCRVEHPRADVATVLLISSDTHRADHVGLARDAARVRTPTIDRLATEGVLFERALSASNVTLPSHVTLMTGVHPRDTGVLDNMTRLGPQATTLAERFQQAGWATFASVSALHLRPELGGLGQGFERFGSPEADERSSAEAVDQLLGWLDAADGRPLFAWLHVFDAHRPYEAEDRDVRRAYGKAGNPRDPALPEPDFPAIAEAKRVRDADWVRALYRAQIDEEDRELARLLDHPRLARAIVAFTADHGENLGEVGLWWDHMGAFPATLRVPLVLRWPGGPRGARVAATVGQPDVAFTLLALAGLSTRDFPGEDLRAWLEGAPAERMWFAISDNAHAYAVTQGRWHLTVTLHNGGKGTLLTCDNAADAPVQLFDLEEDPRCERDLAAQEHARTAEMGAALVRFLEAPRTSLADGVVTDEATLEALAELGYVADVDESGAGLPPEKRIDPARVRALLAPYSGE